MNNELYIKIFALDIVKKHIPQNELFIFNQYTSKIFNNQLLIEYVIHSRKSYELRSMKTKLILMQFVSKRVGKHSFIMLSI